MPKIDQFTHSRSSILYSSQRQIERIAMLKWQMNPSDYHFLCPQKWGNIGLTSAHNKIIEMKELYLSNCSKRQRERVIYSTFFAAFSAVADADLARVRPHFNPSFCLQKWEKMAAPASLSLFRPKTKHLLPQMQH